MIDTGSESLAILEPEGRSQMPEFSNPIRACLRSV